jgi:hypothetical protein
VGSVVFSNREIASQELTYSLSQEELMDVQWDLLVAKPNQPKMAALVRDKIGAISPGSSSHRAGVLKVALKKAFELKKKEREPPGVLLRCSNYTCAQYNNHASRSEIGTALVCSTCYHPRGRYFYFECTNCGFNRTDSNYMTCQTCGRKFV